MKTLLPLVILVSLLAGCTTAPQGKRARSAEELRALGQFHATVDFSGSMAPLLKGGDELLVTVVPFEQVRVGMVVFYWPHWKPCPVVHLVIAQTKRGFICKGIDNRDADPEPMTAATFIGKTSRFNQTELLSYASK